MPGLQTEFDFVLPKGYVDSSGMLHRQGTMRLATARDELEPLRDMRVKGPDDPFLTVVVLSRVITRLGTLAQVTGNDIQGLFAVDLAYLQDFYGIINFGSDAEVSAMLQAQQEAELDASAGAEDAFSDDGFDGDDFESSPSDPAPARRRGRVEEVPAGDR